MITRLENAGLGYFVKDSESQKLGKCSHTLIIGLKKSSGTNSIFFVSLQP